MSKAINLNDLIGEMEMQFEEYSIFYNKENASFVTVNSDNLRDVEDGEIIPPYEGYADWEIEEFKDCEDIIEGYNDKYIKIPSKFEIDEYSIMEEFCLSLEEDNLSDQLYYAIKGKGAFRRFNDLVQRYNIADNWYRYKDNKLREIAIEWCEDNDIEYIV